MKKWLTSFITVLALICISILLSTLAFIGLFNTGIVSKQPSSLSDWVSAIISSFAFVSGSFAVYLAYKSMRLTQKAEEGNLYLTMMERYSSTEMVAALRRLSEFYNTNKGNLPAAITDWNKKRILGESKALEIDAARHLVKYFFRDLMQLVQAEYFSEALAARICNTGGRHIFHDVVLPMDHVLNPFQYEGEYNPFNKIYDRLRSQQVIVEKKSKIVCLIPARYDASRFDGKLLKVLVDKRNDKQKTVIRETYERMASYGIFDEVMVVTNSHAIKDEIERHGGKVYYSNAHNHQSGTDRIAEAVENIEADIIFNVQGDEPFIAKKPLESIIEVIVPEAGTLTVVSLMKELKKQEDIDSSDFVKVTVSKSGRAINFSRSVSPYPKKEKQLAKYYEHVGVYAFTRQALLKFTQLEPTPLERIESVECLRFLENDIPIKMVETDTFLLEIDTETDLNNVNNLLEKNSISLV